jgi:tRNA pseudouridine55 synthase
MAKTMSVEGLLLLDKQPGPTSHDLVLCVRRATGQPRVGHAGTLDPLASGLLPVLLGRATRLAQFLPRSPKLYTGSFRLGLTSSTDDIRGTVLQRHEGPLPRSDAVREAARALLGPSAQVPPTVSARHVGGVRLYQLARRGLQVQAKASPIEVFRFELGHGDNEESYDFEVEVSGGTYVRALVRDLGARLGCGAVLASLCRTRIGPLELGRALRIEPHADGDAILAALVPLEKIPLQPPALSLGSAEEARQFCQGRAVPVSPGESAAGARAVLAPGGELLGIGELETGRLLPRVVLAASR